MGDFTKQNQSELTPRAPTDRRAARAVASPFPVARRRRRHDNLYQGKPAKLLW